MRLAAGTAVLYVMLGAGLLSGQAPPSSPIVGVGNFSHIVGNLERSLEFYHDVIGLEITTLPRPFDPNPTIMRMGNTPGAQSRIAVLKAPGSGLGVELIEYKDIDRKPAAPRFQDPGAGNFIVRLRDLDEVMARVKKSGTRILTAAGGPVEIGGGRARNVFVQDPDGFILELAQPNPLPAADGQASGHVIGTAFEVTVEDASKSAAYYRELFGLQMSEVAAFNGDKLMTDTAGTPGAQFRQTRAAIPGTSVTMTLIEFKDIERKPLHTRVQDPGTALIQLLVRDLDSLLKTLKARGATVVSVDGEAVSIGSSRIAIVRDPNNLFLELIQR